MINRGRFWKSRGNKFGKKTTRRKKNIKYLFCDEAIYLEIHFSSFRLVVRFQWFNGVESKKTEIETKRKNHSRQTRKKASRITANFLKFRSEWVCAKAATKNRAITRTHTPATRSRAKGNRPITQQFPIHFVFICLLHQYAHNFLSSEKKIKLKSEKHNVERRRQKKKPKRKKAIAHFSSYRFHGFFFFYKIKSQIRAHWHNTAYTHWLDGNKQRQIDGMRKKNIITRNLGSHCVFSHEQQQNTAHYFFFKFLFFQVVSV